MLVLLCLSVLANCDVVFSDTNMRTKAFRASTLSATCLVILWVLFDAGWTHGEVSNCLNSDEDRPIRVVGYTVLLVQATLNVFACISVVVSRGKRTEESPKQHKIKFTSDTLLGVLGVLLWGLAHSIPYHFNYFYYTDAYNSWTQADYIQPVFLSCIAVAAVGMACMMCERKAKQRSPDCLRTLALLAGLVAFTLLAWNGYMFLQEKVSGSIPCKKIQYRVVTNIHYRFSN